VIAAQDLERHDFANEPAVQTDLKLTTVFHRFAIKRDHNVSRPYPRSCGRAPRTHVGDDDTVISRQFQTRRQNRSQRLRADTDIAAADTAVLTNLLVHTPHDVARCCKSRPGAGFRGHQRIDSDQVAAQIDKRPATAARADQRIRLGVDHG
jgi:hypothetical protein